MSKPTDPVALRAAIETAIVGLEKQRMILDFEHQRVIRAASDLEQRAMRAVTEGRDDLAKQALVRHGTHVAHADELACEIVELDATLARYRTEMTRS